MSMKKSFIALVMAGVVALTSLCGGVIVYAADETVSQAEDDFLIQNGLEITPGQLGLKPCSASAVVMNPNSGEVLACVTYPGYDNNRLANHVDSAIKSRSDNAGNENTADTSSEYNYDIIQEIDIDEEIKRISRKTNVDLLKSERTFDNRIKNLEKEIEKASQTQIKDFDKSKELVGKYLSTDFSSSTIDNYRRKLKKI